MNIAACVLLYNPATNKILTVSRKDNSKLIGLPGGKVDPGEDIRDGAIRECFEETGYDIKSILSKKSTFVKHCIDHMTHTFLAIYDQKIEATKKAICPTETGHVAWSDPEELISINSPFREYNYELLTNLELVRT